MLKWNITMHKSINTIKILTAVILIIALASMAFTGCSKRSAASSITAQIQKAVHADAVDADNEIAAAMAPILTVKQGDSIQDAIDKAEIGSKILISSGTYTVDIPLIVNKKKDIRIIGDGDVRILGERTDRQIFKISDSKNIVLKGIRAWHKENPAIDGKDAFDKRNGSVIDVENCTKVTFENCEFEGCGVYGIYTEGTREVDILGCYIHHNSWKALAFHNKSGNTNVYIKDCIITNNAGYIEETGDVVINLDGENVIKANNAQGYKSGR